MLLATFPQPTPLDQLANPATGDWGGVVITRARMCNTKMFKAKLLNKYLLIGFLFIAHSLVPW